MASIGKRGASSDEDAPAKKKKISTDDEVLTLLKNFSKGGIDERKTEILMHQWIKGRNKNAKDLLAQCGLSQGGDLYEAGLNILENVGGLGTVLSIFCSSSLKFSPVYFKEQMKDLGMSPNLYHRLYQALVTWKDEAEKFACSSASSESSAESSFRSSDNSLDMEDECYVRVIE